jgi:hypothetical protein
MDRYKNKQVLCLLENEAMEAYRKIEALDSQASDEEIASALLSLGRWLVAYREFTGVGFTSENQSKE